jgi:transcriptional regulator with XRE-family HTH domain
MGQADPGRARIGNPEAVRVAEDYAQQAIGDSQTRLGTYLRKLREGYGYTLRKVEERAMAMGEAIDNSQLSRFEKGKSIPSFDKLRALARVFNVPIQNFSDVLDLEEYQHLKPAGSDYGEMLKSGAGWMDRGEYGRAFVTYERALELAEAEPDPEKACSMAADARWRMASALKRLGKLYMTERELREILKQGALLPARIRLRTTLYLSSLYRELTDFYLAAVLAKECLELAEAENALHIQAAVLNTLGNISHDEGQLDQACVYYQQALAIIEELNGHHEIRGTILTNLGGCLGTLGRTNEGLTMLREAHSRARQHGFRRLAALSLTRMAEAFMTSSDYDQAHDTLAESDTLASRAGDCYHDILFLNSFHRWSMARGEGNDTREKIAFGRLRHLRSLLQRRFPEVEEFDRHIERNRR